MGTRRAIQGDSPCAYRVVIEHEKWTSYRGPYSTLGAAKGVASTARKDAERWHKGEKVTVTVQKTPDGWEAVDV